MLFRRLLIAPPLAFARLGSSPVPLEAFSWGPNHDTPGGTGKTTIRPETSLHIAADGTLSVRDPDDGTVRFKDEAGIRPVCPFFELHGCWEIDGRPMSLPLTSLPDGSPLDPGRVHWQVEVANLKPYFMTGDWQTRIHDAVSLTGRDVDAKELKGTSPSGAPEPLVPQRHSIRLGAVRAARPDARYPAFRLRFTPGKGCIYGPSNLEERWKGSIPRENLFLNPRSSWCSWRPSGDDPRGIPGGQYAQDEHGVSLGLVDDICDGVISCWIDGLDTPAAHARIVVAPPDYAPDRRPLVSIADGLKDRVDRDEVRQPQYFEDPALVEREVIDMLERALETIGLSNLDVLNDWAETDANPAAALFRGIPYRESVRYAFPKPPATPGHPLPLTERGRQYHRRFVSPEVFADFVRKRPGILAEWVRPPRSDNPFFTTQMPALMRDGSGQALHLTRRQYDLLLEWARRLQERARAGS